MWFEEPGAKGKLQIEYRNDGWYVVSPEIESDIECKFKNEQKINQNKNILFIEATTSRYATGFDDNDMNYLYLKDTVVLKSENNENTQLSESSGEQPDGSTSKQDNIESYECDFCTENFDSTENLMEHTIHCDKRPEDAYFVCEYCGNKYVSVKALDQHLEDCSSTTNGATKEVNTTDGTRTTTKHECSTCGKQFNSAQKLLEHKSSHSTSESNSKSSNTSGLRLIKQGAKGIITDFYADDGYGFITTTDLDRYQDQGPNTSVDVFFHVSTYPGSNVEKGEKLRFDIKQTEQGLEAINISQAHRRAPETWDDTFASKRPRWGKSNDTSDK